MFVITNQARDHRVFPILIHVPIRNPETRSRISLQISLETTTTKKTNCFLQFHNLI